MKKDLLSMADLTKWDVQLIFKKTDKLYKKKKSLLKKKSIAMIFEKASTRTRLSFEVAMEELGGHAVYFSPRDSQLSRGETVPDTAKVISRYVDGIVARLYSHKVLVEIAKNASVPVINGLTDFSHPCQALADLYTIKQKKGKLEKLKLVFLGDGSANTCHSLIRGCKRVDMNMIVSCPPKYKPKVKTEVKIESDPLEAVKDADVLYTDAWYGMGQEKEKESRVKALKKYQLNSNILKNAKPNAIVMHCLPAHRGMEITDNVMDGSQSVILDQAENRLHVQKAILHLLIK